MKTKTYGNSTPLIALRREAPKGRAYEGEGFLGSQGASKHNNRPRLGPRGDFSNRAHRTCWYLKTWSWVLDTKTSFSAHPRSA